MIFTHAKFHVKFKLEARPRRGDEDAVGATATTSRRRGRPVIDGGSLGAVGVATQVAGPSYVDVAEADTYARECEAYAWECGACAGNADSQARVGCECDWVVNKCTIYWCIYRALYS